MNQNKIFNLKDANSFAVIGCGRFGRSLALELVKKGKEILAIDESESVVNELAEYVTVAVQADVTEEDALNGIGLKNVDVAIIAMSTDFEASVMATTICKEKDISYIVAKAKDLRHKRILETIGADSVVLPEREQGIALARELTGDFFSKHLYNSEDIDIKQVATPKEWAGKMVKDLNIRKRLDLSVLAIVKEDGVVFNPGPNEMVEQGTRLYLFGPIESFKSLEM